MPQAIGPELRFEGLMGAPMASIDNLNQNARAFLPYDPTIVEIGAHEGAGTISLAQTYPHGRIFACEPNPRAFAVLEERVRAFRHVSAVNLAVGLSNGTATLYVGADGSGGDASLLAPRHRPADDLRDRAAMVVSCVVLDQWCAQQGLARVEFLRLDAGGLELQILQTSPRVLETVLVVVTKTHFHRPSCAVISYPVLRLFLEMTGFELLSHWYREGGRGEATFVRRALYDSVFR